MSKIKNDKLEDVISYVQAEGRVFPKPDCWVELWKILPERNRVGPGIHLPHTIFAAWQKAPNEKKRELLAIHLKYAAKTGVLEKAENFLKHLNKDQWLYEGGID